MKKNPSWSAARRTKTYDVWSKPATKENVQAMTSWLFSLGHAFGSNPTKAVENGLAFKPDTLWLLSDGQFSSKVPGAIRAANASTHAQIHTVGLEALDALLEIGADHLVHRCPVEGDARGTERCAHRVCRRTEQPPRQLDDLAGAELRRATQ